MDADTNDMIDDTVAEAEERSFEDGIKCGVLKICDECPKKADYKTRPGILCEVDGCHFAQHVVGLKRDEIDGCI